MKSLKPNRMMWIFIVSIATAFLAILSGWLQYKEKINSTEKSLKKEQELNEVYKKLQNKSDQIIDSTNELLNLNKKLVGANEKIIALQKELQQTSIQLNKKAEKVIEENAVTGELEMDFDETYTDSQKVFIIFGGLTMEESINGVGILISLGGFQPIKAKILNKKLLISMDVYDKEGNLIAEIENNNWRPNKNFTGKFNYDRKGFEVVDNQGNVAANFDILDVNKIKIQGIFPYKQAEKILIAGDKSFRPAPFGTKEIEEKVLKMTGKRYDTFLNEIIKENQIIKLFEYTGNDWLHRRKKN